MSTIDKVHHALELYAIGVSRYTLPSLDQPLEVGDDGGERALGDALPHPGPTPEEQAIERERREILARRMRALDDRERSVLALRFAGWSLGDLAIVIGATRERARQIEARAKEKILAGESPGPPAPRPRPPARQAQPKATDPRRVRMISLWTALKAPDVAPEERERLRAEHAALDAELRREGR